MQNLNVASRPDIFALSNTNSIGFSVCGVLYAENTGSMQAQFR
jgi:hypothetical protein